MIHSILVAGGRAEERLAKTFSLGKQFNPQITIHNLQVATNNDPDFFILDSENSTKIAQIRALQKSLSRKPFKNPYKIAFFPHAENLTLPAQQALLKTLEEPPAHTIIILSAPACDNLLPTIVSRCQIITLASQNQIQAAPEELKKMQDFLISLIQARAGERLVKIQGFLKDREGAEKFCQTTLLAAHELLQKNLVEKIQREKWVKIAGSLQKTLELLAQNINVKLALENMVLDW